MTTGAGRGPDCDGHDHRHDGHHHSHHGAPVAAGEGAVFAGDVVLTGRHEAAGIVTLTFDAPAAFAHARAGTFLIAAANAPGSPPLGRPVSILSVDPLTVSFARSGPGTTALSSVPVGRTVHIVGPLGRPFAAPAPDALVVTDASHFGTLLALVAERRAEGEPLGVLFVAREGGPAGPVDAQDQDALLIRMFAPLAANLRVTSPSALGAVLSRSDAPQFLAGAADGVMAVVQSAALARGIGGQAAMQAVMGCGIGVCQSCVRPLRDGGAVLVCEGPVFALDAPAFGPETPASAP